jgi:hypothetical protein
MNAVVSLLFLSCIAVSSNAQLFASANEPTAPVRLESPLLVKHLQPVPYKVSYPPGYRMRNAGRTLTIIGGAMLIGGIIVYDNADPYYDYNSQGTTYYTKEEQQAALGVLMIMGGTGMTIPGIILWSKGGKKYKRHLEREAAFNFQGTGVSLSYRF